MNGESVDETWPDGNPRIPGETREEYDARMTAALNNLDESTLARNPDGSLNTEPPCWCGTRLAERLRCPLHDLFPTP